jgi:DNA-binding NarL/FixJ family response regulator
MTARVSPTPVAVGQRWSLVFIMTVRTVVTVIRLENDQAICRTGSGREHPFSIRTLSRGGRCARLITHADGTPAELPEQRRPTPRRTHADEASDLHRSGTPLVDIARQLKTTVPQVVAWIRSGDGPRAGMPSRRQPPTPRGAPSAQALKVFEMRNSGLSNAEVAKRLGIAANTASKYYTSVLDERGGA